MAIANIKIKDLPVDKQKTIRDRQKQDIMEQLKDGSISATKRKKLKSQLKDLGI